MAEVTIDQLRLGAKMNLYADPAQPSQAAVVQPSTARSATTLSLPQKGQISLNSSMQSANIGYNYPGELFTVKPAPVYLVYKHDKIFYWLFYWLSSYGTLSCRLIS